MPPRPKHPPKAKHSANQAALDRLVEQRINSSDRYAITLKRAIDSVQNCTTPITTHQEACQLKYVGSHCATLICPPDKERQQQRHRRQKENRQPMQPTKASAKRKTTRTTTTTTSNTNSSSPSTTDTTSTMSNPSIASIAVATTTNNNNNKASKKQRKIQPPGPTSNADATGTFTNNNNNKEIAYQRAVIAATNWKQQHHQLTWRVLLIIDAREQRSVHVQAKCQMSGIPCEERHLPIGDMAWIAQGWDYPENGTCVVELMLGTILERKTIADLKASLFGTRYMEQRLRLQHCGLPQILFLVEGDIDKEEHKYADHLHTAVWETRLHMGFSIVHTINLQDTVLLLKRMHRRILQRTFPRAFQSTSHPLPNYMEDSSRQKHRSSSSSSRRRPRRSLHEMTFNLDPVPPLGTSRFITYTELQSKVKRDREVGTKTVGNIHLAMLKQVPTFSHTKCHAIAKQYPTMYHLMRAYQDVTGKDATAMQQMLVANLTTGSDHQMIQIRTVGTRSSAELCIAYNTISPDQNDNSNEVEKYEDDNNRSGMGNARNELSSSVVLPAAAIGEVANTVSLASHGNEVARPTTPPPSASLPCNTSIPEHTRSCWEINKGSPCIDLLSPAKPEYPLQQVQRRSKINDSFGSLLDSSSSEDDNDGNEGCSVVLRDLGMSKEIIEIDSE